MSDSKVFMFPETGASNGELVSLLAPLLQQKGLDPNLLLMSRNNCGFGGEGGWFMWIIFLFFLMGWGGNGFGGFGNNRGALAGDAYLGNLINNDTGRELLMSAIQGNGNVISACEGILKDLNPRFAREKERDEDISNLKTKIGGIETKMDKILTLLAKGESK